jgi:hypothetical protein
MRRYYDKEVDGEKRKIEVVPLFKVGQEETSRFHFIFCLDESGSMAGTPWQVLLTAYSTFINKRCNDQGMGDVVSTITFQSNHISRGTCLPIQNVHSKAPTGVWPHIYTYTDSRTHAHPHTYKHTYTHTCIHVRICRAMGLPSDRLRTHHM